MRGEADEKRQDHRVGPTGPAHPEHAALGDRQRQHSDRSNRADRRHEGGDVHLPAEVAGRRDVADEQEHREHAEHVPFERRVAVRVAR